MNLLAMKKNATQTQDTQVKMLTPRDGDPVDQVSSYVLVLADKMRQHSPQVDTNFGTHYSTHFMNAKSTPHDLMY